MAKDQKLGCCLNCKGLGCSYCCGYGIANTPREPIDITSNGLEHPSLLPTNAKDRKRIPIGTGVLDYFPAALAEIAKVSFAGNEQHNPGQPLHWAREKSTDQSDTMIRHFLERGTRDVDGQRHSAKMVWRALAILQLELEAEGAPIARGAIEPIKHSIYPGAVIKGDK